MSSALIHPARFTPGDDPELHTTLAVKVALGFSPADIYALTAIVACGRLYRFGPLFRLDVPDEAGRLHVVSAASALRLAGSGFVEIIERPFVPFSNGTVQDTPLGFDVARLFGWQQVGREWNERPLLSSERMLILAGTRA